MIIPLINQTSSPEHNIYRWWQAAYLTRSVVVAGRLEVGRRLRACLLYLIITVHIQIAGLIKLPKVHRVRLGAHR